MVDDTPTLAPPPPEGSDSGTTLVAPSTPDWKGALAKIIGGDSFKQLPPEAQEKSVDHIMAANPHWAKASDAQKVHFTQRAIEKYGSVGDKDSVYSGPPEAKSEPYKPG